MRISTVGYVGKQGVKKDFVKKYKTWKNVIISYGDEKKTIHKWKYDDLVYKMSSKRIVGNRITRNI